MQCVLRKFYSFRLEFGPKVFSRGNPSPAPQLKVSCMLFLVLSSFLFGLEYPLASMLIGDVDALEFAFHFLLVLSAIQLPFVLMRWQEVYRIGRQQIGLLMIAGLIGTFLYWCEFSSLKVGIPISHLTFISLSVPAWALLYEYLRGRGTGWNLNKWMLALVGSIILIAPGSNGEFSAGYLLPIFTSLLTAGWIIYSKKALDAGLSPIVCNFFNDFFSLIGITMFIFLKGRTESITPPETFNNIALYAIAVGMLPNLFLFYGLQSTSVISAATMIVLEPVITGIVVVIASQEAVTLNLLMGSILVFSSTLPDNVLNYVKRLTLVYGLGPFR